MSHLVVAAFNDGLRAQQAMSEMVRLYKPRPDLDNALVLTWNGRDPIAHQSQNLAERTGAGWGRLWGSLLCSVVTESGEIESAVSSLQRVGSEPNVPTERRHSLDFWVRGLHVPPDFFRDLAALITPGRSAIFFVSRSATIRAAADVTHGYGGTLLSITLTGQQLAKIRRFVRS